MKSDKSVPLQFALGFKVYRLMGPLYVSEAIRDIPHSEPLDGIGDSFTKKLDKLTSSHNGRR